MKLKDLIDKGLLRNVRQIDLDEAQIGVCFEIKTVEHGKIFCVGDLIECLVVQTKHATFYFPLNNEVTIDENSVVVADLCRVSHELCFKQVIDVNPSQFV